MDRAVSTPRSSERKSSSVTDTIEVKQKTTTISRGSEPRSNSATEAIVKSDRLGNKYPPAGPNIPWARKDKEPIETPQSDPDYDHVEEWEPEDDMHESDFADEEIFSGDDAKSVISLSSEISARDEDLPERPWRQFNRNARWHYEIMFCNITAHPMHGTWDFTEDYQREKDAVMVRYLEDFPIQDWLINTGEAAAAYARLVERDLWRSKGTRIYGFDRQPPQPQQPQNPPRPQPKPQTRPTPSGRPSTQSQVMPQGQQPSQPQRMPPHLGQPPPPPGVLPSQPYAQSMQPMQRGQPPPGIGRPVGSPMTYGMSAPGYTGNGLSSYGQFPVEHNSRTKQSRAKKYSPPATTPPPPPPTPPYEIRTKPSETRKGASKAARKPARRQAEAEEFPWTRAINFPEEKAKATWDDSIYDPATLQAMQATRERNSPIIDQIDSRLQETQRKTRQRKNKTSRGRELTPDAGIARAAKKSRGGGQNKGDNSSDAEFAKRERKKRGGQSKGEAGGDAYHSGAYSFASEEYEIKARQIGYATPDEAIEAGVAGKVEAEKMAELMIIWNPGKKGMTENLEQARFSVRDNVLTRKQLDKRPILTKRAAECIVDFCPDMLWRGMLLRITSEGGYGNKDVRDRFCLNGCYCDKATITKRISAALGQKQVQPKSKGYQDGELEWYEGNVKDFTHYIDYFGMRTSHRNMLKIQLAGDKRRAKYEKNTQGQAGGKDGADSDSEVEMVSKRPKTGGGKARLQGNGRGEESEEARDDVGEADGEESGEESDDSNAVSLQDSDILDRMDEDDG